MRGFVSTGGWSLPRRDHDAITTLSRRYHDAISAWPLRGLCVASAWPLRGLCVASAWPLRGLCVASAWLRRRRLPSAQKPGMDPEAHPQAHGHHAHRGHPHAQQVVGPGPVPAGPKPPARGPEPENTNDNSYQDHTDAQRSGAAPPGSDAPTRRARRCGAHLSARRVCDKKEGEKNPGRKGSRKNNFGIRPPIHQFCLRRSSVKYVNVFALLAS